MKTLKGNSIALAALALVLTSNFALAQANPIPSGHSHVAASHDTLVTHDRTPHVRDHSIVAHR